MTGSASGSTKKKGWSLFSRNKNKIKGVAALASVKNASKSESSGGISTQSLQLVNVVDQCAESSTLSAPGGGLSNNIKLRDGQHSASPVEDLVENYRERRLKPTIQINTQSDDATYVGPGFSPTSNKSSTSPKSQGLMPNMTISADLMPAPSASPTHMQKFLKF